MEARRRRDRIELGAVVVVVVVVLVVFRLAIKLVAKSVVELMITAECACS